MNEQSPTEIAAGIASLIGGRVDETGPVGPPGLIPIIGPSGGPGYVTPAEAIRRGATRYRDGSWNLTTVHDYSVGGAQSADASEIVAGLSRLMSTPADVGGLRESAHKTVTAAADMAKRAAPVVQATASKAIDAAEPVINKHGAGFAAGVLAGAVVATIAARETVATNPSKVGEGPGDQFSGGSNVQKPKPGNEWAPREGMTVDALRDDGLWHTASVLEIDADEGFKVQWTDGKTSWVERRQVRPYSPTSTGPGLSTPGSGSGWMISADQHVDAQWTDGKWYGAKVIQIDPNMGIKVAWDDGTDPSWLRRDQVRPSTKPAEPTKAPQAPAQKPAAAPSPKSTAAPAPKTAPTPAAKPATPPASSGGRWVLPAAAAAFVGGGVAFYQAFRGSKRK